MNASNKAYRTSHKVRRPVNADIRPKRRIMKLILLVGKPQTGKTTVLNLLYNELATNPDDIVAEKTQVGGRKDDFECVLKCTVSTRMLTVGIFTMGDYLRECIRAAHKYSQVVDVLVLAYSDKFKSGYGKIAGPYPRHFVVNKTVNSEIMGRDQSNLKDVVTIRSYF